MNEYTIRGLFTFKTDERHTCRINGFEITNMDFSFHFTLSTYSRKIEYIYYCLVVPRLYHFKVVSVQVMDGEKYHIQVDDCNVLFPYS